MTSRDTHVQRESFRTNPVTRNKCILSKFVFVQKALSFVLKRYTVNANLKTLGTIPRSVDDDDSNGAVGIHERRTFNATARHRRVDTLG